MASLRSERLPGNQSCQNLLAWCWVKDGERYLIVINFRQEAVQAEWLELLHH